jgi:L-fucose isomerase-like protein
VTDRNPGTNASAITDVFGATVRQVNSQEYNEAYQRADSAEARKRAQRWIKGAQKVMEPTTEEIEKSAAIYLAMKSLMDKYNSRTITVDCLGLFYAGKAPAYPCLGFFQFNNDGLVGACEADLQSTITMLSVGMLTGRPGFISDPVVDTSKNQIIYAHCVAPNKVHGINGPSSTYYIRSHSEDRKGASVRVVMPVNEMTTTLRFNPVTRQAIFHQAKAVDNIDDDKACRTKLAAEVKDVNKILEEWDRWGWHRVTFYGDLRQPVETLSSLLGISIVREG